MNNKKNVMATGSAALLVAIVLFVGTTSNAFAEYNGYDSQVQVEKNKTTTIQMSGSAPQEFFYIIKDIPLHGYVEYDGATGQAFYTPNLGYTGPDSFTFVTAALANSHWFGDRVGTVTINVVDGLVTTNNKVVVGGEGNRMPEFGWYIANALNERNSVVPDSGMQMWQLGGVMNGILYTSQLGADFTGIGWNNLSEGQQVWIIVHWEELVAEGQ